MKRFWKTVGIASSGAEFAIDLDGRPVKTPARALLTVPNERLAEAIAEEWRSVEDQVDPRAMPLTGLANAAIDRVAPDKHAFAASLARYAEADLACYRAEGPRALAQRQEEAWDRLLAWGRRRYDVDFVTTCGLMHVAQPAATVELLSHAVAAYDPFHLAGLSPLVTVGGSLIGALAVAERAMTAEQVWDAVAIDEQWQREQWGEDAEAELALENRRQDFFAGAEFLSLLD